MHPNRLARALRNHPDNLRSSNLPGGTIVSAVLDRALMTWSDRGGASRIFGEIWSEYCWNLLTSESPKMTEVDGDAESRTVLRLDANPRIAMQAGRNKLPNPDFLVLSDVDNGSVGVRAIDAKFAIDRIRRTQISPKSIQDLIELPGSLVRREIAEHIDSGDRASISYQTGAFLGPRSLLNDYYFESLTSGDTPSVPTSELHLIDVHASDLFADTPEIKLMQLFRALDRLRETDSGSDILAGMYYLRIASAARWFEQQTRTPLLSLSEPDPVPIEEVFDAAQHRIPGTSSAYEVILAWSVESDDAVERQTQVRDAARLPVRMSELRTMVQRAGFGDDKKRVRMLRGWLERKFMRRLIEEVGEIPARPSESISTVVERIRDTSRRLKPDTVRHAAHMVQRIASEASSSGEGGA
jgi:hypothetical protein